MGDLVEPANQRRNAEARRERIIGAARKLFAAQGFHGTGMAQIARESGILVGQIYRDFQGKVDLIAAIVERDIARMLVAPELSGGIDGSGGDDLRKWVRRFINRSFDDDALRVLADILAERTRNPRVSAILTHGHEQLREHLAQAARIWSSDPTKEADRQNLADLILAAAGATHYFQLLGVGPKHTTAETMIAMVEAEIDRLAEG